MFVMLMFPQAVFAFADVPTNDKDYEEINHLYDQNIIQGYSLLQFGPDNTITRAELLKIAIEGAGTEDVDMDMGENVRFTDVKGHSLYDYIEYAYYHNIIQGYDDNTFRPNQPITMEEATKVLLIVQGYVPQGYEENSWLFLNDLTLDQYYVRAAQQDLYEMSLSEYRNRLGTYAKRRDIARAMSNILDLKKWADMPIDPLFECSTMSGLTNAEKNYYFDVPSVTPQDTEICIAEDINFAFTLQSGQDPTGSSLMTFINSKDSLYYSIKTWYTLEEQAECEIGDRVGLEIAIVCEPYDLVINPRNDEPEKIYSDTTYYNYNFITGSVTQDETME